MDLETVRVLKSLNRASSALATLKGQARTIPNQGILIVTLALQEAKASSEVENIVTMQELASGEVDLRLDQGQEECLVGVED